MAQVLTLGQTTAGGRRTRTGLMLSAYAGIALGLTAGLIAIARFR